MARARWPADPPLEVPKLISSSRSYGFLCRTSATSLILAGSGPPGVPRSAASTFVMRTNVAAMHQEKVTFMNPMILTLVGFDRLFLEYHAPLRDLFLQVSRHLLGCTGD